MRARFMAAIVLSLVLAISFGSEAKTPVKAKAKAPETKLEISGQIVSDSCGEDTARANRVIIFSVEDKKGKAYSCRADSAHPANADWDYLKGVIVASRYFCFSGTWDKNKKYVLVENIITCKD
jgi:hypothetical protein